MKLNKKVLIPVAAVLAVGAIGFFAVRAVGGKPSAQIVDTYRVAPIELTNSVDVTGMVESANSVSVYSPLSGYTVKSVEVEVGDVVSEGDVLCTLDIEALETSVRQTEASLGNAQAKANLNVAMAQKDLANARSNLESNYDLTLLTAESRVRSAEEGVKSAAIAVKNAEITVENAEATLRKAESNRSVTYKQLNDLREGKRQAEDGSTYDDAIYTAQQKDVSAALDVETSENNLATARNNLENAKENLESAKESLREAELSYEATAKQVEDSEVSTQDRVASAQLNANLDDQYIALEKLKGDISKGEVAAPVSGTVTAVYAKEGAASQGLLVVIEDTGDLKVSTKIKEYDIASVKVGMPVVIKADGTGDAEFEGALSMIAPTTIKDATGSTVSTSSAEFEAEVSVNSGSDLRIGMNARMNIITENKESVLAIPAEAIAYDDDGSEIVYVLTAQEDGTSIARKVAVTIGMETDFYCEITGTELKEGDEVITDPTGLTDGARVMQRAMNLNLDGNGDSEPSGMAGGPQAGQARVEVRAGG